MIMRALQIPETVVELFIWHMTHLFSFLGEMGVMIPSGAMHTYDFNTLDSMAFFALKHDITPHLPLSQRHHPSHGNPPPHPCSNYSDDKCPMTPYTTTIALAFSGDDTLANQRVRVHPGFMKLPHSFALKSTGTHSFIPHFTGKLHTKNGSFPDPTLLTAKLLYKISKGSLPSCALSYAGHCFSLHRNLTNLFPHLSAYELMCHGTNVAILRYALAEYGLPYKASLYVKKVFTIFNFEPIKHHEPDN
uniref:Putative RdRp n=1 Tax=Leucocoprinus gammaflexivirus D TaxID=2592760 RepID=A0A7G3KIJ8_9VIRU|nr:putative RdRp [Leucocoprinus gammaflexivirus D]